MSNRRKNWPPKGGTDLSLRLTVGDGGMAYTIKDMFLTDRLAGAINDTYAEPGPGQRTIGDPAAYITILNDTLVFTESSGNWLTYYRNKTTLTRVPGLMLLATLNGTNYGSVLQWNSAAAGLTEEGGIYIYSTGIQTRIGNNNVLVNARTPGTDVEAATILRAVGSMNFAKISGNWVLLNINDTNSTANMYPGITSYNGTGTAKNFRVPVQKWLPSPVVSDGLSDVSTLLFNLNIDDNVYINNIVDVAEYAALNGVKLTIFAVTQGYGYDATRQTAMADVWTALNYIVTLGHDVGSHTRCHRELSSLLGIKIQYVGAGAACTMTIGGDTLTTIVTGGPGGENLNIDLTAAAYKDTNLLISYINGLAAYTCEDANVAADGYCTRSTNLADIVDEDIATAEYDALLDETKFFADEIDGSKADIEANIAGYTCKSFAVPRHLTSAAAQAAIKSAGYLSCRGQGGDVTALTSTINMYNIKSVASGVLYDKITIHDNFDTSLDDWSADGYFVQVYDHGDSVSRWITIIDALAAYKTNNPGKVELLTFEGAIDNIIANGTTGDAGVTYDYDPFNIDGKITDGIGHAEGVAASIGSGGDGIEWTTRLGTIGVTGNKLVATALDGDRAIATLPTESPYIFAKLDMNRGTTGCGILMHWTDASNYQYAWHDGTNVIVVERLAGAETAKITTTKAHTANKPLTLHAKDGTTLLCLYNIYLIGENATFNSSLNANNVGVIFFDLDSTIDNLRVYNSRHTANLNIY